MRKTLIILVLVSICLLGCFSSDSAANQNSRSVVVSGSQNFSEIIDKEWKLIDVYVNNVNIQFSRENQIESFRDIYTLKFEKEMLSGTGAPNRYSAPYTLGDNQSISIMPMRSTLMASLFEPNNLSEYEYYSFVQNSYEWRITGSNLELISKRDNDSVLLIFGQ